MNGSIHYSREQEEFCAQIFSLRKSAYNQIGWEYRSPGAMPDALSFLRAFGVLFAASGQFTSRGSVRGQAFGGQTFQLSDVTARSNGESHGYNGFEGVVVSLSHKTSFSGLTLIRRDRGAANPPMIDDLKRVGFVSSKFEEKFEVYSDDQVAARALITPDFMERLTALDSHFLGRNIQCGFQHNQIHICLEIDDRFDFNQSRNFYDYKAARAIVLGEMASVFTVLELAQALLAKVGRVGPDAMATMRHSFYKSALNALTLELTEPPMMWEEGEKIDPDMRYSHFLFDGYLKDLITPVYRGLLVPEKPKR